MFEALADRVTEKLWQRREDDSEGFIRAEEAAAYLACPKSRVYDLVSTRRMPHHRDGSRLLFDRSELREWVMKGGGLRT
jgi:excisionase family DNA binding protein